MRINGTWKMNTLESVQVP